MKNTLSPKERQFQILFNNARIAGLQAVQAFTPREMVVRDPNTNQTWRVPGGVCGFAEVIIRPGNCPAANFAKKHLGARKHYYGGMSMWISEFGQSMETKEVYADAYAKVLNEAGITASSTSRMD